MHLVWVVNNLNEPSSGILDNDKNGDGIPDFILQVSHVNLKSKLYTNGKELKEEILKDDSKVCMGIEINEGYEVIMHFDDTVTRFGRTQSNIPSHRKPT